MKKNANAKDAPVSPLEQMELDKASKGRRIIAAVLFLILAAGSFAYGFHALVRGEKGWREIKTLGTDGPTSASDFVLMYDAGSSDEGSAQEDARSVTALYTQAALTCYRLFTPDERFDGLENVRSINEKPNQVLTVGEPLYSAIELLEKNGLRQHYLGPIYAAYDQIGLSEDDVYARAIDPWLDAEAYYGQIAAFAADPASVQLELLGDGKLRLAVSEEYLAFAGGNDIHRFIDFGWMKNAFIADYIAGQLAEGGYSRSILSSFDGFSRVLGPVPSSVPLMALEDGQAVQKGIVELTGPVSTVSLRAFPSGGSTAAGFYRYQDGTVRTPYICMDGKDRAASGSLTAYSGELSCAEMLVRLLPLYLAESLDVFALDALDGMTVVLS